MSNNYIKQRINEFNPKSLLEKRNALKQVIQEIVLNCLEKIGFFKEVAFCGGTCLRIFYNLPRFSEDLDFSLIKPNKNFDLSKYFDPLSKLLEAFGLKFKFEKYKANVIQSVFLKGETKVHMLKFFENVDESNLRNNEITRIKLEIDTNPPLDSNFKEMRLNKPITSFIKTYGVSTLFASKINAILTRTGNNNRVKGRDLYDFLFYINKNVSLNLKFLHNALVQFGVCKKEEQLTVDKLKKILIDKFKTIDYEFAKQDVVIFLKDEKEVENWNKELFIDAVDKIK